MKNGHARASGEVDVSTLFSQRSTPNQKAFYEALRDGKVESIMPRGNNAQEFFNVSSNSELPKIDLENSLEFFVNDMAVDGYNIFKKVLLF